MRYHEERVDIKEAKQRQAHSPEFKAKVGLEALRGMKTVNEIGLDYGVHPGQVGLWKKEIQEQAKTVFEGKRVSKPVAAHQEPDLLYSKIGKLKAQLNYYKNFQSRNLETNGHFYLGETGLYY